MAEFNTKQKRILSILPERDQINKLMKQNEEISKTTQTMSDEIHVIEAILKPNFTMIPASRSVDVRA